MDLTEEDEGEDVSDHHDHDDYRNYPGEHHSPEEEDPNFDPLLPDDEIPDAEKDRE